ncbi:sodium channel protein Nach-like [Maniola jurtina]|uniref:sodium channel protein Nach-like n=1 Tax=Maniola jurtina TaxID=191418 RepID=UPI001E68A419|nr:sodium channel protein Nach-like [Maniola jurtina]
MLGLIAYFLQNLWFENLARPLIVTMDTTYPIANIEFPAVTLCNFNRISKKSLDKLVKKHFAKKTYKNESRAEMFMFFRQLGRLIDFSYNKTLQAQAVLHSFAKYIDEKKIDQLMEDLAPPCGEMLVRCAWAGELIDCNENFHVQRTVHGHCCAFNLVIRDNEFGGLARTSDTIKRQYLPGQLNGLNVILDPMVDDYSYTLFNMFGFEVLIYDATHYADHNSGSMIQRIAQPGQAAFFEIYAVKQIATEEVRKYPPTTRKCLFRDDIKERYFNMYSYSACIVRCRIKTLKSLCKCVPYYVHDLDDNYQYPKCTIDHLGCLNRYKEKLFYLYPKDATNTEGLEAEIQGALYCPECLPDCELTRHHSKHSKLPLPGVTHHNKELSSFFFEDLNMTGKCLLSIYQGTTDGTLNRFDIVFYWFEIISNVGGFCGILIGFSIITILEFVYFFVFRFFGNLFSSYYYNNY